MRQATIDLLHVIPLNAGNICDPDASVSRPPKSLNLFLKSHFTTRVARKIPEIILGFLIILLTRVLDFAILYLDKVNNMKNWDNKTTEDLFKSILKLKNIGETKKFFRDLLTAEEIIEFGKRWQAAQMLNKNISYEKIVKENRLKLKDCCQNF